MAQSDQEWNSGCACSCPVGLRHLQAHGPVLLVDLTIERERGSIQGSMIYSPSVFFTSVNTEGHVSQQIFGNSSVVFYEDLGKSGLTIVICK